MGKLKDKEVINGTFGSVWVDSEEMSEVTKLQAKVGLKKTAVPMCGQLNDGYKVTGTEYKGSLKMHKVSSRLTSKVAEEIKKGKSPEFTVISKLADPEARGYERIALYGVSFDEINLIDWEAKKLCEDTLNFTFMDFEYLDKIE